MADPTEDVTMAILSTKLDRIKEDTTEIKLNGKASEARITAIEIEQARNQEQHKRMIWGQGLYATVAAAIGAGITTLKGG